MNKSERKVRSSTPNMALTTNKKGKDWKRGGEGEEMKNVYIYNNNNNGREWDLVWICLKREKLCWLNKCLG